MNIDKFKIKMLNQTGGFLQLVVPSLVSDVVGLISYLNQI